MEADRLTEEEKKILLRLAREALEGGVRGEKLPKLKLATFTARLREDGASFVTLTKRGDLRGCVGALEPYQPLAEDVREHSVAAALDDFRFSPVQPAELNEISIEVSRLSVPIPLEYNSPEDLLTKLKPNVDGVILRDGRHRATFLPQVWEKLPDRVEFLENLCYKLGAEPNAWRKKHFEIAIYRVEEFHE